MNSTFKIQIKNFVGTAFILGKPSRKDTTKAYYVLVTAHHVLDSIKQDYAVLHLRTKVKSGYQKLLVNIPIRKDSIPLWVKHPKADVAAMYVSLPKETEIQLLTTNLLATDEILQEFEIHPGDELLCLGYPYGAEANDFGFPILRSGKISSFPLTPTKIVKSFLFDFEVFGGNSGGPVYFIGQNRIYKGGTHIGEVHFLMGLVTGQIILKRNSDSKEFPIALAQVIHASFIKELIDMLPNLD